MKYGRVRTLPRNRAADSNRRDLIARMTRAERMLAAALDRAGERWVSNYRVSTAESFTGYYLADFYLPGRRLFIEVDGGVHRGMSAQWKDRLRTEAIVRAMPRTRLVRVWNREVIDNADGVAKRLLS